MKKNDLFNKIIESTNNFKIPSIIGDAIKENYFTEKDIKIILNNINLFKNYKASLRVYVNDVTRDLYINLILANPPIDDETLEEWGSRIFGNNKYCIILNKAEIWNDDFLFKTINTFKNPISYFNYNEYDHEIMLFIGNYEFTPFGVHIDGKGDNSFQINICGNSRKVYLWTPESYHNLTKKKYTPHYFPKKIIPNCDYEYELEKDKLFILPASTYFHVYSNNGFNVSLAYFLKKNNENNIFKSMLSLIHEDYTNSFDSEIDLYDFVNKSDVINKLTKQISFIQSNLDLKKSLNEYITFKKGNLGFTSTSIKHDSNCNPNYIKSIRLIAPFKISYYLMEYNLFLSIRGHNFKYRINNVIINFLCDLNNRGEIEFHQYSKSDNINSVLFDIVSNLISLRIVEINI